MPTTSSPLPRLTTHDPQPTTSSLRTAHRFLGGQAFYTLAFASILAVALLVVRAARLDTWDQLWFTWNLLLA